MGWEQREIQSSGPSVPIVYVGSTAEMTRLVQKQHGKMKKMKREQQTRRMLFCLRKTLLSIRYLKTGLVYRMKGSQKQNTDGF